VNAIYVIDAIEIIYFICINKYLKIYFFFSLYFHINTVKCKRYTRSAVIKKMSVYCKFTIKHSNAKRFHAPREQYIGDHFLYRKIVVITVSV